MSAASGAPQRLAVIVPAHNERDNIPYFYSRAVHALDRLPSTVWEIVFVNNDSNDGTLEAMLKLRAADERVKVVTLSRDFGYHPALLAGLSQVDADLYAIIDVDCEDPPELLVTFREALSQDVDLAYGIRSNREEPWMITLGRRIFYVINRQIADSQIVLWMGEFSMFTRQVRDAVLRPNTTYPFLRAELGYIGFAREGFHYQRERRRFGASHYNVWRLTRFAIGGILSSSTFPLRFVLYLAVLIAVVFPVAAVLVRADLASAAIAAVFVGLYFILLTLPILALYIARTYKNGVARPVFLVDRRRTHL